MSFSTAYDERVNQNKGEMGRGGEIARASNKNPKGISSNHSNDLKRTEGARIHHKGESQKTRRSLSLEAGTP